MFGSSGPLAAAELFTLVWKGLAEVLGTAATATLVRRAATRAAATTPDLPSVIVNRNAVTYEYEVPAIWRRPDDARALDSLRTLVGELGLLLRESPRDAARQRHQRSRHEATRVRPVRPPGPDDAGVGRAPTTPSSARNQKPGTTEWLLKNHKASRPGTDGWRREKAIEGYCSHASIRARRDADRLRQHRPGVAVPRSTSTAWATTAARAGGTCSRNGPLDGEPQPTPTDGPKALIECRWKPSLTLEIPDGLGQRRLPGQADGAGRRRPRATSSSSSATTARPTCCSSAPT